MGVNDKEIYEKLYIMVFKQPDKDMVYLPQSTVKQLLNEYKLSKEDIYDVILNETNNNVFFKFKELEQYAPKNYSQDLITLKNSVLTKLPAFLKLVVANVVLELTSDGPPISYHKDKIIINKNNLNSSNIKYLLGTTYWKVFKFLTEIDDDLEDTIGGIASGTIKIPNIKDRKINKVLTNLNKSAKANQIKAHLNSSSPNFMELVPLLIKLQGNKK